MTEVKKVTQPQFLRSVPKLQPFTFIPSDSGGNLQVDIGETVNVGAKPDVDETVDGRALKWIFVEATTGQQIDKRKGFVLDEFLAPADTDVPTSDGFEPFSTQVNREDYANTCYLQAALNGTNPAYLYALAFASSGDQWSATVVKTDDPPGALAFGVYRFSKKAWQQQTTQPEAEGIEPDDIKFPDVQCIMAAILAAKSAELLKGKITDRPLTAVDLMLAFLCNDTAGFGSEAAVTILQADKTKQAATVLTAIYPDPSERAAFFKRNAHIFKDNGSATIDEALTECASRLAAGFAEADKIADDSDSDVFGDSIPSMPTDPIPDGSGAGSTTGNTGSATGTGHGGVTVASVANGIDRTQFLSELNSNPALIKKSANMVKGEVGWGAPHNTKLVQLETAFNRAMARGHSLARALLSTSEDRRRGYYQGGANGTYSRPVTSAEFDDFKKTLLQELLAGSNKSEELLGFIATGNASPPTSTAQFASGTRGGNLPTALPNHPESYFDEGPHTHPFKRFQGGEAVVVPSGPSSGPSGPSLHGEPPEHMDGDTEGRGPSGGKFNVKAGSPLSPQSDRQTVTFSNGQTVVVNKAVAEQFRGFFNDLIKFHAPVRGVFGFGMRGNPSEHPIGFATDWNQQSRNKVTADVQQWIDSHRDLLRKLERRWGISGGENWHNPDTGHFSIERIFGDQHLQAAKAASARD
ncbi:hypothetical protein AAE026_32465 [Bradyrhizobium sp. DN5]|uniref:hypothetical protein n=2 Tax=unclassified Bradyrhizobium TaxID=2631580 RepID=UPI003524506E